MTVRFADLAAYAAARAWVVVVVLVALTAIKLAALASTPAPHPERVVVRIP